MTSKIRIAIQKSGRLSEASLALIKECGIDFNGTGTGRLKAEATNFPAEILFKTYSKGDHKGRTLQMFVLFTIHNLKFTIQKNESYVSFFCFGRLFWYFDTD